MKQLHVDWDRLEEAYQNSMPFEFSYYLDLETGEVQLVTDEARRHLERLVEEYAEEHGEEEFDLDRALESSGLHDWQKQGVREADEVEADYGGRYIAVPQDETRDAYEDMVDFIDTVSDQGLKNQLSRAIQGRGAFRSFKDVLYNDPSERQRWFAFSEAALHRRIRSWSESEDIEPLNEPESRSAKPPQTFRSELLEEVLLFTQQASNLPGITRIALIGSLTTEKDDPKDADMLVTVEDDVDLTQLATLGRKLQGHAQSLNRGGEVFLTDPDFVYIGRTCPWKRCGPGIRASCEAYHCGRREYLHDDFDAVRLDAELTNNPPIELWPAIKARVPVPDDLEELVLEPLRAS